MVSDMLWFPVWGFYGIPVSKCVCVWLLFLFVLSYSAMLYFIIPQMPVCFLVKTEREQIQRGGLGGEGKLINIYFQ